MDRFLALAPERRARAFQQASAEAGWSPESIEKDFWVCLVLRELFTLPDHGGSLTFKGGTSLSKAWKLIDRFSEDVDLTLDRDALGFGGDRAPEAAPSRNELRRRLRGLAEACRREVQEVIVPALQGRLAQLLRAGDTWPPETREFYMLGAIQQRWTKRELERQIWSAVSRRKTGNRCTTPTDLTPESGDRTSMTVVAA